MGIKFKIVLARNHNAPYSSRRPSNTLVRSQSTITNAFSLDKCSVKNKKNSQFRDYSSCYYFTIRLGKTSTCLALISGLKKRFRKVGFLKPVGQQHVSVHSPLLDRKILVDKVRLIYARDPPFR